MFPQPIIVADDTRIILKGNRDDKSGSVWRCVPERTGDPFGDRDLIRWEHLSAEAPLYIPYGSRVEVIIQYEERDYLQGTNGIVWATYHLGQAETIQAALLAQSIGCEVQENVLPGAQLYLLHIPEPRDVEAAADFIWRDRGGLRLKPDWHYLLGSENESFTKWVKGI